MLGAGELKANVKVILSNHSDLQDIAQFFGIPFRCIPQPDSLPEKDRKARMEDVLEDLHQNQGVDLFVLAR